MIYGMITIATIIISTLGHNGTFFSHYYQNQATHVNITLPHVKSVKIQFNLSIHCTYIFYINFKT